MATRQMLEDVLADGLSTESQKDQARHGLHKLDYPERVVALTVPTTPVTPVTAEKPKQQLSIDRVGLIFSGQEPTDDPAGYAAADQNILASGRCPQWNGPAYRIEKVGSNPLYRVIDGDVRMIMPYAEFMHKVNAAKMSETKPDATKATAATQADTRARDANARVMATTRIEQVLADDTMMAAEKNLGQ